MELPVMVAAAYILDLIAGDPYWLPHPVVFIGKLVGGLERLFRRMFSGYSLKIAGVIMTVVTVGLVFAIPYFLLKYIRSLSLNAYYIISTLFLYTCFASRCLDKETRKVYRAVKNGDLQEAREKLSYLVGRDTNCLTEEEVIKAAVETIAENTVDGIVSPLFYAFIGGVPLALAYKAVNTLDSMVGYKNKKYKELGWFSARTDDWANFIPARITGFVMVLISFLLGYDGKNSYRILLRDRKNHTSPNSAHPEAAVAGAFNIQLGGTHTYFGEMVYKPTIGDNIVQVKPEHIRDAAKIMYLTGFVSMVFFSIVYGVLCFSG